MNRERLPLAFLILGAQLVNGAACSRSSGNKQKISEPSSEVKLSVAGSLTAAPATLAVTVDADYGKEFGIRMADSGSSKTSVSAYVAQFPSKRKEVIKTFAGLPFVVTSLADDKDVELSETIKIALVGNAKHMAWRDTESLRKPGLNHVTVGPKLNKKWLLAFSTRKSAGGFRRMSRGKGIAIIEEGRSPNISLATLTTSNLIVPSNGSEVPCLCDEQGFPSRIVPTAIGVVWVFEKKGTEIVVGKKSYRASKDGATIQFTQGGPVIDDVDVDGPGCSL